ncbi:MAG: RNA polymerase factor sigma-54 [Alphaproteobacteria bacterium]|nr:RNA polymerase factor sigma-54 [Alphaproteobacteria bacterium]
MAVTPHLDLKQTQSLVMTPELRQAINLLQVSNLELNALIEKELEQNPLLEREDENSPLLPETAIPTIDDYAADSIPDTAEETPNDIPCDNECDDFGSDREGYDDAENRYDWQDYAAAKNKRDDDDYDFFEQKLADEKSLYRLLDEQISQSFISAKERSIALNLVEHLDDAGYFREDLSAIAKRLKIEKNAAENILNKMQEFEPSGIFARSLSECLKIQLRDKGRLDPVAEKVLNNLELLGDKKFAELKKICRIDDEDLASVIDDIKSLNPKPAAEYHHDLTSYIIPDVFVRRKKDGSYRIELNNMSLPRILVNRQYYSEVKDKGGKTERRYLKQQLGNAGFLVRALRQRAETILKVTEEIVRNQYEFFEKGIDFLRPMQLKNIAEQVEMHESTVSRVTSNKYMHTPLGIFELKYFFTNAAGSYTGDDATSTLTIKHKIKKMIDEEKPDNILSDDKIVDLLGQEGIKIARRTVAKYRDQLDLASSAVRKKQKTTP